MISDEQIRKIILRQIDKDEKPGDRAGGSGHMANKSFRLDGFQVSEKDDNHLEVIYRYTVFVETEFTYHPDNPPEEYRHEKRIVIDRKKVSP